MNGPDFSNTSSLARFTILGVTLDLHSSDDEFIREFESVFGGRTGELSGGLPFVTLDASVRCQPPWGDLLVQGDTLADPAAFLAGFSSPTVPLRAGDRDQDGWMPVLLGDDPQPMFRFKEAECRFRLVPRWRRIVAHFLFLRMLAMRQELLFFHAAAVGMGESGVLLIGPKGSGKSTLSVGLASRGHQFLGDETAAYLPKDRSLLPFRRPVAIKPGPRAEAVERSIHRIRPQADEEGILRVEIDDLFAVAPAQPMVLDAVVFLSGFGENPHMEKIQPGREQLSLMQPMATMMSPASVTARVFEMVRLLSSIKCYKMTAGSPDQTIQLFESVFAQ